MIVRRVGTAQILAVIVGIATLGCRDATGPKPAIASPTSYDATATPVDYEYQIVPVPAVRSPRPVSSELAGPGLVVCAAFRCGMHRSEQPADAGLILD